MAKALVWLGSYLEAPFGKMLLAEFVVGIQIRTLPLGPSSCLLAGGCPEVWRPPTSPRGQQPFLETILTSLPWEGLGSTWLLTPIKSARQISLVLPSTMNTHTRTYVS